MTNHETMIAEIDTLLAELRAIEKLLDEAGVERERECDEWEVQPSQRGATAMAPCSKCGGAGKVPLTLADRLRRLVERKERT